MLSNLGDVQPLLPLRDEFRRHSHRPVLALAPLYRSRVIALGLEHAAGSGTESAEAFRWAVSSGIDGQLVIATGDLMARLERWVGGTDPEDDGASSLCQRPQLRNRYTAPRTSLEASLVEIWEEVLGIQEIGVEDNFFDLGGHSLLATRLIARIRLKLEIDLPLQRIFETPTVAGLAEAVASSRGVEDDEVREILAQLAALSEEDAAQELSRREP